MKNDISQVIDYWDKEACGSHFIDNEKYTREFFNEYRIFRFKKEHHLLSFIQRSDAVGKDILEIGVGLGADSTIWAKYAKSFTGIDITNEAVMATKKHFDYLELDGNMICSNAEELPFKDNSFDIIYSYGVLHHTVNLQNAIQEIHRILRTNGKLIIMLYSKSSFNYWIRIQLYFRLRMLFEIFKFKINLKNNDLWSKHINNYNQEGWKYLSWNEFPHHCTDGPDCKIANIYYTREIIKLLKNNNYKILKTKKVHFPITKGKFPKFERGIANFIGFFQFYWAEKE